MATDRQKAHGLITYFVQKYAARFGGPPPGLNRNTLRWGFESLSQDYPNMEQELIDFFIDNNEAPLPDKFVYEYGEVAKALQEFKDDSAERMAIRRATKERMMNVNRRG